MELSSNEDRYLTALLTATLDRWLYVFPAKRNQIELKAVYPVSDSPFIRPSRIPDMPKFKLKKILMDLLGSSGTQTTQVNEASEAQTVTQSISSAVPQIPSHSPFLSTNPVSSRKSLSLSRSSSPSPPWQAWTLDRDFFREVYDWNASHRESMPDRIINGICTSIDQHKDLFEVIPDGPIPIRGLVKALAHLMKLGATIVEAKTAALQFTQEILLWVEQLASAFGDSGNGLFVSLTWENLAEIRKVIEDTCEWARRMLNVGLMQRASVENDIFAFEKRFKDATGRFEALSGITLARGQDMLVQMMQKIQHPQTIPDVSYEFQKKHPCDDGTRKEILDNIMEWTNDISDTARCFFWLSGDPGIGKSAITASIAKECKRRRVLWAQYFINRNDARTVDPRFFFPSIAQQMSRSSRAVEYAVQETLKDQPDLMNEDISIGQATKLFVNTIQVASKSKPTSPVVVVIDALDETDFKRLADAVEIFSKVIIDLPCNAKVFVSSRAEDIIRDIFGPQLTNARVRHMHLSAKDSIPEVTRFLEKKISGIMNKHHISWSQWGEERMKRLCTQASGLFIWAVTAIEYIQAEIEDSGRECLGVVLDELNANGMDDINELYLAILNRTCRRESGPWRYQRFRRIIGAILVQQNPLCIADLEGLLDLRNPRNGVPADIEHFVRRLRTVLVAGAGEINRRTFPRVHRSFADFVTSAGAKDFRVDKIESDGELAIQCIRQLNRLLDRSAQLGLNMPAQLPYAASYWSSHLTRVVGVKMDEEADNVSIDIPDAGDAASEPDVKPSAPAVAEAPENRNHSSGHSRCFAVSSDGRHALFVQGRSVQLRDTQTGEVAVGPLEGHTDTVFSAVFSPDGTRMVSASADKTIRVWDSRTGEEVGSLQGHTDTVFSAVFSPAGTRIVSASADCSICVWDSQVFEEVGSLQGHTDTVFSAVFSPDGTRIVSASADKTIRVWNSSTGQEVGSPLQGHTNQVLWAVFSPDGHIVSASVDNTIRVWEPETGQMVAPILGDRANAELSFTYSDTVPYIVTPPRTNMSVQGASALSYFFHLDGESGLVGGVVNADDDTWLYMKGLGSERAVMGRYLGQLIMR